MAKGSIVVDLLEVGDTVRLRSGGGTATVVAANADGSEVDLLGWTDGIGFSEAESVPAPSLVLVERGPLQGSAQFTGSRREP